MFQSFKYFEKINNLSTNRNEMNLKLTKVNKVIQNIFTNKIKLI